MGSGNGLKHTLVLVHTLGRMIQEKGLASGSHMPYQRVSPGYLRRDRALAAVSSTLTVSLLDSPSSPGEHMLFRLPAIRGCTPCIRNLRRR